MVNWQDVRVYDGFDCPRGDFAICSDLHTPKLSLPLLEAYFTCAKRHKLRQALILGDFFDEDDFSHWVRIGLQPGDVSFGQEVLYAAEVLEGFLRHFERIHVIRGNHDERILRVLHHALGLKDLFSILGRHVSQGLRKYLQKRLQVSEYTYCVVNDSWFCGHPDTYSRVPGGVARDVAETEGMNCILGNGHQLSLTRSRCDRYWAVDSGCLVDPTKVYYKSMSIRRFPHWNQGFVLLKHGVPLLVHAQQALAGWP